MSWKDVLDGVDAVESWIAGQSYWVQVPVLLVVLVPLVWLVAGGIDRIVERLVWPRTRREMRLAAAAAIARHDGSGPVLSVTDTAEPTR
ncbi:hypothetical protein SAMN04515671_0184 [Nakamurella panacisegetis]|uniref:Uncharacterized protein n=1 Tax=Nakamurella panacisegetis TaxID=1090615 RepID=A0A1H0HRV4_9ACTN|nr:hypothetical protein [Nakamurella panacisegetis]SDO21868.1 hypothetical protein SAMN04515671_0184 [Nakamurella panacisegetis]